MNTKKMSGWKTKAGGILIAIATMLASFGQQEAADAVANSTPLLEHADALIGGIGAMLTVFGLGHKIEKAGQ